MPELRKGVRRGRPPLLENNRVVEKEIVGSSVKTRAAAAREVKAREQQEVLERSRKTRIGKRLVERVEVEERKDKELILISESRQVEEGDLKVESAAKEGKMGDESGGLSAEEVEGEEVVVLGKRWWRGRGGGEREEVEGEEVVV